MSLLKQLLSSNTKCLRKFIWNFGVKGAWGFLNFRIRKNRGGAFPAFQFISLTDDCNLKCQGCWVSKADSAKHMPLSQVSKIIEAGIQQKSYFFGILGGEPLMYKELFDIFEKHSNAYFQLFTNGTLLTEQLAQRLQILGNITPVISFEGNQEVADIRRGGNKVYNKTIRAVENSVAQGLITGVAISVCKSNIEMALSDEFVEMLIEKGVIYLWYYIYRPSGENPQYELALEPHEIQKLRQFMVDARTRFSIVIVDSYWNGDGEPFCPAAEGLSHHINPYGDIEPCPVIQFATDNINDGELNDVYEKSTFLRDFRLEINKKTQGCILMEDPQWIVDFVEKHQGRNTSNRSNSIAQLQQQAQVCSHGSCKKIPEKKWMYKLAKKGAFGGLGAYG